MKICYFGFWDKNFPRNLIILQGLRQCGNSVDEHNFQKVRFKYFKMTKFLFVNFNKYDLIFCAYPSYTPSIIASLISRLFFKIPVVLDATSTYFEQSITSRKKYGKLNPKRYIILLVDYLSFKSNYKIFVESKTQMRYCLNRFRLEHKKLGVIYSGADNNIFKPIKIKTLSNLVIFRGKAMNEVGFEYILEAADILKKDNLNFELIISGDKEIAKEIQKKKTEMNLKNVNIKYGFSPIKYIISRMSVAFVSLGQFSDNQRVNKTIPYKCYESMAVGLPYITARSEAISEIMSEFKNCLFVKNNNGRDIADKIIKIHKDRKLQKTMSKNNINLFDKNFNTKQIGINLTKELEFLVDKRKK